jgi:hypothetical protein
MTKSKIIKAAFTLIIITFIIYPGYLFLYLYPSFHHLIITDKEYDAKGVVNHISVQEDIIGFLMLEKDETLKEDRFFSMKQHMSDFNLSKIKILTDDGRVAYSTTESEIGDINSKPYYKNVVAKGNIFSKEVLKGELSAGGIKTYTDIVEIYVPVMRNDEFLGAIEVYYDITNVHHLYRNLFKQANRILFILGLILVLGFSLVFYKSSSHLKKRQLAEKRLKEQEAEMESIKDILPICSYCKNIRNDDGYWAKVEEYIHNSTHANLSHGICPDCYKEKFTDNKELQEKLQQRREQELGIK